ncbi:MAG: MBL fold metallo-hydrolase [Actinobacteria bacterium]|nr:MBL fold metallo-hydrolase [Actinomycetota bacterium]
MSGRLIPVSDRPWSGGRVSPRAVCVLAPNASPMTLDGTNTWILAEPGAHEALVIDPGPLDESHLTAISSAAHNLDVKISVIALTHDHIDHSEGAAELAARTGAQVLAWRSPSLLTSQSLLVDGLEVEVLPTPGHSADGVTFYVRADAALLTGDTVLGRGTTVVAWPDGNLGDYFDSLQVLRDAAADARMLLPGHGPALDDPAQILTEYVEHRQARLQQVREALRAGARTPDEVVDVVYAGLDPALREAALLSTRAQLAYLAD